jgi:hypothetical protein
MAGAVMEIQGYKFSCASQIDAEREVDGKIITWKPTGKYYKDDRALHKFGHGPFATLEVETLRSNMGVYLVIKNEVDVMFVGATRDAFSKRWGKAAGFRSISPSACYQGGDSTYCRVKSAIVSELEAGNRLSLWIFTTADPLGVKRRITGVSLPPWNINS